MAKVDITTAGHTIIVEGDEPVEDLAKLALALWHDTRDPKLDRNWGSTGFSAERSEGGYVSELDATLRLR